MKKIREKLLSGDFENVIEQIDLLNDLAWSINRNETDAAIEFAGEALLLAEEHGYSLGIGRAKSTIGMAAIWKGEYEKAANHIFEGIEIYKLLENDVFLAQAYYNASGLFYFLDDPENQLKFSYDSFLLFQKLKNDRGMAEALNGLGMGYLKLGKAKKALHSFLQGLEKAMEVNDLELSTKIYDSIGEAYLDLGKYDDAILAANEGLRICAERNDNFHKTYLLIVLSGAHSGLMNFEKAEEYMLESLHLREKLNFISGAAICREKYGGILLKQQKYKQAINMLKDLELFCLQNKLNEVLFATYNMLSVAYEGIMNYAEANRFLRNAIDVKDQLEIDRKERQAVGFELQIDLEKQEKEARKAEVEKAKNDTKLLSEIGRLMTATLDLDEALNILFAHVRKLISFDSFVVRLVDYNEKMVVTKFAVEGDKQVDGADFNLEDNFLTNWSIKNGREIFIGDYEVDKSFYDNAEYFEGGDYKSALFQPLILGGEVLGVISIKSKRESAYRDYQGHILKSLANYCSIAIQNAMSFEELEKKITIRTKELLVEKENMALLNRVGQRITSSLSISEIISQVYNIIKIRLSADSFGLGIFNPMERSLDFSGFIEDDVTLPFVRMYLFEDTLAVKCFSSEMPILINSKKEHHEYFAKTDRVIKGNATISIIYVPLMKGGQVTGVLTVQSKFADAYSQSDFSFVKNLVAYVSIAIGNAQSFEHMETLSEIGRKVSTNLDIVDLATDLHIRITQLMDTSIFLLAFYDEKSDLISHKVGIEDGELITDAYQYQLSDKESLTKVCIQKREILHINNEEEIKKYLTVAEPYHGSMPSSIVMVPLLFEDKPIGVFSLQSLKEDAYDREDIEMLKSISSYLAVAINNLSSFESVKLMGEIGRQVTSLLELKPTLELLHKHVSELMDAETFKVGVYHPEAHEIHYELWIEKGKEIENKKVELASRFSPEAWCVNYQDAIFINDLLNEYTNYVSDDFEIPENAPESMIYLPLMQGEEVFGIIAVQAWKKNAFTKRDKYLLKTISTYAVVALRNAISYQALQVAHRSLEELSIVASETDNAVMITDNRGDAIYINRAYEKMVGMTLSELIKTKKSNIFNRTESDRILEIREEMEQTKTSRQFEYFREDANGKIRWIQTTFTPLLDEWGFIYKYVAIDTDITEIKEISAELEASQKEYRKLFTQIADSIFVYDNKSFKFIDFNDAVLRAYGYTAEEILQMTPMDLHPQNEVHLVEQRVGKIKDSYRKNRYTHITKSGEEMYVEVRSEKVNYLGHDATISIVRNVTEGVIFEQKIIAQNLELEKLSIVASHTNNIVIICSPTGEMEWANNSFQEVYGSDLENWKLKHGTNLRDHSGSSLIDEYIMDSIKNRQGVSYESFIINYKGDEVWFNTSLSPVFSENGQLSKLVIIDSDITSQKKVELEIQKKNKNITDSINYASRIQNSLLPSHEKVDELLPDSFIFFKPRDIVSGDFYWMTETDQGEVIVAAVDCTGHGVPGAFLTIIGHDLLNNIVNIQKETRPAEILDKLNQGFLSRFQQKSSSLVKDSMDVSIVKIKKSDIGATVVYAGAFNSIYYKVSQELIELRPNRIAIGTILEEGDHFEEVSFVVESGSMLYMFSDGYADQIGGEKGKKYLKARFKELLEHIENMPTDIQLEIIEKSHNDWRGERRQLDDILVIGVRI